MKFTSKVTQGTTPNPNGFQITNSTWTQFDPNGTVTGPFGGSILGSTKLSNIFTERATSSYRVEPTGSSYAYYDKNGVLFAIANKPSFHTCVAVIFRNGVASSVEVIDDEGRTTFNLVVFNLNKYFSFKRMGALADYAAEVTFDGTGCIRHAGRLLTISDGVSRVNFATDHGFDLFETYKDAINNIDVIVKALEEDHGPLFEFDIKCDQFI